MNFDLDEFGIDEPLLDDAHQQNQFSSFFLDQPINFFEDLNSPDSEESLGSSGQANTRNNEFSSSTCDSFASQYTVQVDVPICRRDSSDESDMGIVDDISIPAMPIPANSTGSLPSSKRNSQTFHQQPAFVKVEPLAPATPVSVDVPIAVINDKKPILPKPCLVISPNGSLTPFQLQQQSNGNVLNVADIKPPTSVKTRSSLTASEVQQNQDEMDRQAKKQLRIIKNREAATLSRQRQKAYLQSLEQRVKELAEQNELYRNENKEMRRLVDRLHEENQGLRSGSYSTPQSIVYSSESSVEESSPACLSEVASPVATPSSPPVIQLKAPVTRTSSSNENDDVPKTVPIKANLPLITVPVASFGVKRDTKTTTTFVSAVKVNQKRELLSDAPEPPVKRIFIPTRPNGKVLLIFSLVFAANCIPFASKFLRESSTNISPVSIETVGELRYSNDISNSPKPHIEKSKVFAGESEMMNVKRLAVTQQNELMLLPSSFYDEDDLPLMDDALLDAADDGQFQSSDRCPTGVVNTTHSQKIVNALSKWASIQRKNTANKTKPQAASYNIARRRIISRKNTLSDSSGLQVYRRRTAHSSRNTVEPSTADDQSILAQYEKFAKTIRQRNDSFYMVSFHVDQLIFPALVNNQTSRPKMSLILPALFSLNETVAPPEGSVALMQIECEISDMKILHLSKQLIPHDIVARHMREGDHADATNRMYHQWLRGKERAAGAV